GTYYCQIINTLVTDLALFSRLIHVTVGDVSVTEQDSLALIALYNSTDGANWTNRDNWLTGPVNTWYGITVESGRVAAINLPNNNLVGSIPSEIGWLTAVEEMYLQSNALEGNVPSEIGDLVNLKEISFDHNDLSGAIPASIGNLNKLEKLGFGYNRFSETIPDTIGNLTNLQHLNLHMNRLTGSIPTALANLTQLTELFLYHNKLSGFIPSGLGNLTHLTRLYLQSNDLEGAVPNSFTNLNELEWLRISYNHLDELPDLSSISTLTQLSAAGNQFTFEDIEPNVGIADFTYTPQDSVGEKKDTTVTEDENLTLFITVGGSANQYQWFKDGVEITDSDSSVYEIESIALSDSGSYSCQITNTIAAELTLYARPIHVHVTPIVGVARPKDAIPEKFSLHQNYPNPFNPVTTIRFDVKKPCRVTLNVYNLLGQKLIDLTDKTYFPGQYEVMFNAAGFPSGLYFYKIHMGDFQAVHKMLLLE
ncbi:T9SS type A sorting domain-containing protein, partial [bacterium]|nr:T9SS type A sorting domain-containing protein [bacterium]